MAYHPRITLETLLRRPPAKPLAPRYINTLSKKYDGDLAVMARDLGYSESEFLEILWPGILDRAARAAKVARSRTLEGATA